MRSLQEVYGHYYLYAGLLSGHRDTEMQPGRPFPHSHPSMQPVVHLGATQCKLNWDYWQFAGSLQSTFISTLGCFYLNPVLVSVVTVCIVAQGFLLITSNSGKLYNQACPEVDIFSLWENLLLIGHIPHPHTRPSILHVFVLMRLTLMNDECSEMTILKIFEFCAALHVVGLDNSHVSMPHSTQA